MLDDREGDFLYNEHMADLGSLYEQHKDLSEAQQVSAGKSPAGAMGDEHTNFVKTIASMILSQQIDVAHPESFFKPGTYEALDPQIRGQVDFAMINIADLLRHIADYYISKKTPDASPQLEQMIEQLWQMKERFEKKCGKILKF